MDTYLERKPRNLNRKEKIRRIILYSLFGLVSLALLAGVWLSAVKTQRKPYIFNNFVMDTFVEMKLYGKDRETAAMAVQSLLERMEQELSCYEPPVRSVWSTVLQEKRLSRCRRAPISCYAKQ